MDLKFEGKVSQVRLQPVTTNNVVTYTVILSAPNPDKKLMPGMTASATIFVEEKTNTLVLSGKAVRFTPSSTYLQKLMTGMKGKTGDVSNAPGMNPAEMKSGNTGRAVAGNFAPGKMPEGIPSASGLPMTGMISGSAALPADMKTVWIKDTQGGIKPVMIRTGINNGTNVEVLSGLKEGDEVVIAINDGTAVKTSSSSGNQGPRGPFPF